MGLRTGFKNLIADAEFNLVASRSAQAAVLKAVKAGNTTVDLTGSNDDDNDTPDPNNPGTGGSTSGDTVTLSVYKNPSLGGSVTAGGTYGKGTQVTIEATPADGYLFDMWSDHVTDNPRTLTLTANKSVTAWFYKPGEQKPSEMEDEETSFKP